MRIVVCVKHVPDIQAERRFTSDGRVDRSGGDGTINELDENAVEAALALTESLEGEHEVIALTMGPSDAQDAVRRGLQMGADAAVHVSDDALVGSDVFATARVLAAAVRRIGTEGPVDLVVTGMAGLDSLTSLLPASLAAELGIPALTLASELTLTGSGAEVRVQVRRELDHAREVLSARLPALVSVTDQANEPRYPNVKGIMSARKKSVQTVTLEDLGIEPSSVGASGARTEVLEAAPRPTRDNRVLIHDDGTAGVVLAAYLVENGLA